MSITRFLRHLEESVDVAGFAESTSDIPGDRAGFPTGIPMGGSTEQNPGETPVGSVVDRKAYMRQLLQAYLACPWASTSIDAIARTSTAGGCMVVPTSTVMSNYNHPDAPPEVEKVQHLLQYVNPHQDIRQLMRGVITDLLVFGDSFTEIVYAAGEPVALYPLDPITITIEADEHGTVSKYRQTSETNRKASFDPHEIIHVKFDTPGDAMYGVSPTQKTILSITTWLFAKALVKDTMKRGDPIRAHVDWPMALSENERKKFQQQYSIRNLGSRNIGNLFETKGGAIVNEMGTNQISHWQNVLQQSRDEILSGYGVPPSKVGVIEAGNLGGGTGTAQDKTFRVNTCGPIQEIVLEKFTFKLLQQAYNITDWAIRFGVVDWRDDEVIELIRDQRIRNGTWTLNKARSDVGEPPVPGGDDAILVDRQNMVLWADLNDLSKANLEAVRAAGITMNAPQPGKPPGPQQAMGDKDTKPEDQIGSPNVKLMAPGSPDQPGKPGAIN
jgi:hypothetical protein